MEYLCINHNVVSESGAYKQKLRHGFVLIKSDKCWFNRGRLHRIDGPAYIRSNGSAGWYKYGCRHREDGPAIIFSDGEKHWYQNDVLHREDGPAIMYSNGDVRWFLAGIEFQNIKLYAQHVGWTEQQLAEYLLRN